MECSNGATDAPREMRSMEMESLHPQPSPISFFQALWALIVAYASYYRGASATVFACVFILLMVVMLDALASHATVHHLTRNYSENLSVYALKMAQIDHWCLQGGDDSCRCNDPTEPLSREELRGWTMTHSLNKKLAAQNLELDVVLLGDEFVQDFTGRVLQAVPPALKEVASYWNHTFTRDGGGEVEGLPLGIAGDSISNLLWRTEHGELPESKVFWIHIGTNDFGKGQCSEEAVLLGILRLAEGIHEQFPGCVVVINSILPRRPGKPDFFGPIQEVNQQLQAFCAHHEHLVFFDATPLFVNSVLQKSGNTLRAGMFQADGVHLTVQGYKTWGNAILERLKLIIYEDDETSS